MGQTVIGLLLGCEVPEKVVLWSDEGDNSGLVEAWNEAPKRKRVERVAWVDDSRVVGVWVAVPWHEDDKGLKETALPIPLDGLDTLGASERWQKFEAFANARGVKLKAPTLWLAPTEVA
jgi:hypothetical protein